MEYKIRDYKIVIPSYKREDILRNKTLKYLMDCKIDPKRIFIFVANSMEKSIYSGHLPKKYYNKIVVAQKGLKNARLFIRNYFGEGEYFVSFDDDIDYLMIKVGTKDAKELCELNRFIMNSFSIAQSHGVSLWGIGSHSNPFFLRNGETFGLRYIVGTFYGLKNTHNKDTYIEAEQKEGAHRSILFYLKDGQVMKVNHVCMKTSFFANKGGLQDIYGKDRVNDGLKQAGEWLINKYPRLVYFKKRSKRYDLALRMLKPMTVKRHRWW